MTTVEQLLEDVSLVLIENPVNTTLNPAGGAILSGINTVTPGSMLGIYAGALLIIGTDGTQEIISVTSTTTATFTATFMNGHGANDAVVGATFPSGQPDHALFTQAEMIQYLADVQNDFLLKVRPVYVIGTVAMTTGIPTATLPSDCIRLERASLEGIELPTISEADAAWINPGYGGTGPNYVYQDGLQTQVIGLLPPPQVNDALEVFYSQRASTALTLTTTLLVPDVMTFILKYGVLERAWSKDGEVRDSDRAQYCQKMYVLWIKVVSKFMQGTLDRLKRDEETVEPVLKEMSA